MSQETIKEGQQTIPVEIPEKDIKEMQEYINSFGEVYFTATVSETDEGYKIENVKRIENETK